MIKRKISILAFKFETSRTKKYLSGLVYGAPFVKILYSFLHVFFVKFKVIFLQFIYRKFLTYILDKIKIIKDRKCLQK